MRSSVSVRLVGVKAQLDGFFCALVHLLSLNLFGEFKSSLLVPLHLGVPSQLSHGWMDSSVDGWMVGRHLQLFDGQVDERCKK